MGITLSDRRIVDGMDRQLGLRQLHIIEGDKPVGWKVGFGSTMAMEKLGTEAPLVGFLMKPVMLPNGSSVCVADWLNPAAEAEIALFLGTDVLPGADRKTARAAVSAVAPAIELVDVNLVTDETTVGAILEANVFNRHVILGEPDFTRAGCVLDGMVGHITREGQETEVVTELESLTGDLLDIVRHVADVLGAFGKKLRAGEFLIMGSIVPPMWITRPETIRYTLQPLEDTLEIKLETR
jgi:2-keto-4-pentenoate hydratase